ncbi:hypothetical protein [Isoptericola sp. NPDC019482]|uniref:hypothetical protein n=1 Tax=Isoptericola sp. NPDC019482 TaxID=3154688 RepID=UPI0034947FD9
MTDPAPRPAEAAALLEQAERVTVVERADRTVWTLFAVAVGVLWGGFSAARWAVPDSIPTPVRIVVPLVVFVGLVVLLWRLVDARTGAIPRLGWMTRLWPGPLPMVMYVLTDQVVRRAGLDPADPAVLGCCALLVALPCLAAAHRIWWDSWIPGRGDR